MMVAVVGRAREMATLSIRLNLRTPPTPEVTSLIPFDGVEAGVRESRERSGEHGGDRPMALCAATE